MSRNSSIVESPVTRTLKWKNEKTKKDPKTKEVVVTQETGWYYWDKLLNEGEGSDVKVDLPISFIWLETASSIMGFSKEENAAVWSNEVLDLRSQVLNVRIGKDTRVEGIYNTIKDEVKGVGGKFCSAVYTLVDTEQGPEVWRFLMKGSANSAWISFSNRQKNKNSKIVCFETKVVEGQLGTYEEPVFKYMPLSAEESKLADQISAEFVEPYFEYMLASKENKIDRTSVNVDADY